MEKKIILSLFFISLFSASCQMSKYHLKQGHYDAAVSSAVSKLMRNSEKHKQIEVLERAYAQAQQRDLSRIEFLKKEGQPESLEHIFNLYSKVKQRQDLVKSVMPLYHKKDMREISFEFINYDDELISAKRKAAEFYYTRGSNRLQSKTRNESRQAYDDFAKVRSYFPGYRDVDSLMNTALRQGTVHVLFAIQNTSGITLPPQTEKELLRISTADMNKKWVQYVTADGTVTNFDYRINLNLGFIDVTPESVREIHYTETKKVQDGWNYVLDSKGNVTKDSLGNDIKSPKYKTISCNIIETIQHKSARVSGKIEYTNLARNEFIREEPVTSDALFEHCSVMAVGDLNALKPETKAKLGSSPIPFPNDLDMLDLAGNTLKTMVRDIVVRNRDIIN